MALIDSITQHTYTDSRGIQTVNYYVKYQPTAKQPWHGASKLYHEDEPLPAHLRRFMDTAKWTQTSQWTDGRGNRRDTVRYAAGEQPAQRPEPKVHRTSTPRLYLATFETQRDRVRRTWACLIEARNQTEARELARRNWTRAEYQFYLQARRAAPEEIVAENVGKYVPTNWKPVRSWY
jgi:hypothetical protein